MLNLDVPYRIYLDDTPYKCKMCLKECNQSVHGNRHYLIHTGETPYEKKERKKSIFRHCFAGSDVLIQCMSTTAHSLSIFVGAM